MLQSSVERHPERPALIFGGHRLDYAGLSTEVDRLADRLGAFATRGERVALIAPNVPALVIAMFAAWRTGAVAVPLNARLREYELGQVLADAQPAAIVSVGAQQGYSFADALCALMPELPSVRGCLLLDAEGRVGDDLEGEANAPAAPELPADVIAVLYTSGTTGRPKGALFTLGSAGASAEGLGAAPRPHALRCHGPRGARIARLRPRLSAGRGRRRQLHRSRRRRLLARTGAGCPA